MREQLWWSVRGQGRTAIAAAALISCAAPTEMVCGCPPSRTVAFVSGRVVDSANAGVAGACIAFGVIAVAETVRDIRWPQSDAVYADSIGRFATAT